MESDFEIICRYASKDDGYIYDPKHEKHPPSGYHKTEEGWSNKNLSPKQEPNKPSSPINFDDWEMVEPYHKDGKEYGRFYNKGTNKYDDFELNPDTFEPIGSEEPETEEHDWTDEEHQKMLDRLYRHVGDREVMRKWLASDQTRFQKYLRFIPNGGLQYYVLDLPFGVEPPKESDSLILNNKRVIVFTVESPEDIAKGRGGPVARSMRENGIAFRVNCLPEGHEWLKRM